MEDRQAINDSYYCGRLRHNATVSVFTGNAYVVAEYDQNTGDIKWHRVVNASQKDSIHNWLRDHFPVIRVAPKAPVKAVAPKAVAPKTVAPKAVSAKVVSQKAARPKVAVRTSARTSSGRKAHSAAA